MLEEGKVFIPVTAIKLDLSHTPPLNKLDTGVDEHGSWPGAAPWGPFQGLSLSVLAGSLPGWKLEQEAAEMVWKLIFPSSENCAANQEKHKRCTGFLTWAGLQRWNCILSLCLFLACCCQTYAKAITVGEGQQEFSVTENLTALLRRARTARQSSLHRHCHLKNQQILAFLLPVLFVFNEKHIWALFFNYSKSPCRKARPAASTPAQTLPCPSVPWQLCPAPRWVVRGQASCWCLPE